MITKVHKELDQSMLVTSLTSCLVCFDANIAGSIIHTSVLDYIEVKTKLEYKRL